MMKMQEALAEPLPVADPVHVDNNRVLLVDTDPGKRKLRLASLTRMGINVCCATDAAQARLLLRESPYDLVLINLPRDRQAALKLHADMKEERPEQSIRFFVGKPSYLASKPLPEHESGNDGAADPAKKLHALIERTCDGLPGRGRLLEAAWRMTFLRRGRGVPPPIPTNGGSAQHSFGEAVRQAEKDSPRE
ncbi:MAG: hypothetical protein LAN37_13225 [Acidobacteriia bacterium]|nr:hypothetical protein [Terriglobia bacterium]